MSHRLTQLAVTHEHPRSWPTGGRLDCSQEVSSRPGLLLEGRREQAANAPDQAHAD
jgi:hypothetical protein